MAHRPELSGLDGSSEARALLDPDWYLSTYPDLVGVDPWTHFVAHGDAERRSPGPGFDAEFYARTYLPLEAREPLRHYLAEGRRRGYLPVPSVRDAHDSRAAMAAGLADLAHPIVLLGNDAQEAGAPLLLLELAWSLRSRGWSPVLLLQRGGPLLDRFRSAGPTLLLDEGLDAGGLGAALDPEVPVVGCTAVVAPTMVAMAHPGPSLLLVQEMPQFVVGAGLLDAVAAAGAVAVGFEAVADALRGLLPADRHVRVLTPGLLHDATTPAAVRRVADELALAWPGDRRVVVAAGYADRRKGFDRFCTLAQRIHADDPRTAFVWLGERSAWAQDVADRAVAAGLPLLLPGFRADAGAWYANADAYLLTSRQDPGPTTVVDAARQGTPFVAAPGDLGLRGLATQLDGVGEFVDADDDVPTRIAAVLRADSPERRVRRADVIERMGDFGAYVHGILDVLRVEGLVDEPEPAAARSS